MTTNKPKFNLEILGEPKSDPPAEAPLDAPKGRLSCDNCHKQPSTMRMDLYGKTYTVCQQCWDVNHISWKPNSSSKMEP